MGLLELFGLLERLWDRLPNVLVDLDLETLCDRLRLPELRVDGAGLVEWLLDLHFDALLDLLLGLLVDLLSDVLLDLELSTSFSRGLWGRLGRPRVNGIAGGSVSTDARIALSTMFTAAAFFSRVFKRESTAASAPIFMATCSPGFGLGSKIWVGTSSPLVLFTARVSGAISSVDGDSGCDIILFAD